MLSILPFSATDIDTVTFRRIINVYSDMHTLRVPSALLIAALLAGCTAKPDVIFTKPPERASTSSSVQTTSTASSVASVAVASSMQTNTSKPKSVQIDVPFASQAPLGNWSDPYQEACEEASLILVHYYLEGKKMTPELMDKEIIDIVAWETAHGYGHDVTMDELAVIAREYYGHDAEVVTDVSVAAIGDRISSGQPVILPLAGRDLGNPYYSGEGPWYHALVVTGYDGSRFITNDVGTKRGEDYPYAYDVLIDAIHDWTGVKEEINQGAKKMLIVTE